MSTTHNLTIGSMLQFIILKNQTLWRCISEARTQPEGSKSKYKKLNNKKIYIIGMVELCMLTKMRHLEFVTKIVVLLLFVMINILVIVMMIIINMTIFFVCDCDCYCYCCCCCCYCLWRCLMMWLLLLLLLFSHLWW